MEKRIFTEIKDDFGGCHALFANKGSYNITHVSIGTFIKGTRTDERIDREIKWLVQVTVEYETIHRWFFKTEVAAQKVYAEIMALAQSSEV